MRRVAVIGVGITKFGKHDRTSTELFAEAAAEAIVDAEIAPADIQALYYGNVTGGEAERQLHMGPLAATVLGVPTIPTTRFETACATSHAAFRHAVMEIAGGTSDIVLVGGAERILNVPTDDATEYFAYCSEADYEQSLGLTFPGVFALIARAHMDRYGTTEEQMAHVAVKNHRHGVLNPKAQFQKEITLDAVLKSAYVADPLKLFDCCPFTDGGAAVVLAAEDVAKRRRRAVWVLSTAAASDTMFLHEKRDLARVAATERAAAAGLPAGGEDPGRRLRRRAARLLHHRRDRRDRGPRASSSRARGARRREGLDQPRRQDPGQPLGRAQGQGTSHRRHRRRPDRRDRDPAPRRGRGARRSTAPRVGLVHTLGGNTATVLVSLFGRD